MNKMNFNQSFHRMLSVTRSGDWWNWKVPTLLASGYASIMMTGVKPGFDHLPGLLIVMAGLVIGAVFASVINDFFDIEDDLLAGKANRLSAFRSPIRKLILILVVLSGLFFGSFLIHGAMSRFFYIMAWISFAMYSAPPFRTKKRGPWGGIFDALGAGFFPTLFVVSSVSDMAGACFPWWYTTGVGAWSLTFGIRGILWHQYQDLQNDMAIGARTFATDYGTDHALATGVILLTLELAFFMVFMLPVTGLLIIWLLLCYGLYAWGVSKVLDIHQVVMYQSMPGEATYFPGTFYQTLWPYLLIIMMPAEPVLQIMLLIIHFLFFQADLRIHYYYIKRMVYAIPKVRSTLRKIRVGWSMSDRSA